MSPGKGTGRGKTKSAEVVAAEEVSRKLLEESKQLDELKTRAGDSTLSEGEALSLLQSRDLAGALLEQLARNVQLMKRRKVQIAIACHPQTPRFVSLPIVRRLYTFELSRIAMIPAVAADVKIMAEESILGRLEAITTGERLALAKQGTTRIAAALLNDKERMVMAAALTNPRMTEAALMKALTSSRTTAQLVHTVCAHPKWSLRREVQMTLLRNENLPFAKAIKFVQDLPIASVKDVLHVSKLPENVRTYLAQVVAHREK